MAARPVESPMPSKRMIAAVRAFLARHPEYRAQVYREWMDHPECEPYLTLERELIGYERGELPVDADHVLDGPRETVDFGSYAVTGRRMLAWQELD